MQAVQIGAFLRGNLVAAKTHVLIVEDDELVRSLLDAFLRERGYRISAVGSGAAMRGVLAHESIDILLLDLGLPDEDGIALARQFRTVHQTPMMILTARSTRNDRIAALEIDANDYLMKPFDPQELALRISNLVARNRGSEVDGRAPAFGGFRFDVRNHALTDSSGKAVQLTPAVFSMLAAFAKAPGRVLSRDFLLDAITRGGDAPGERVVDVVVGRLRKKMGDDPRNPSLIKTVTGFGYMLQADS